MTFLFDPAPTPVLPIEGEDALYPVRRIFCVGRNYAAHAVEMGGEVDREAPWYFTKSATALCQTGQTLPYPPGTENYHHEMELVMALIGPAFRASLEEGAAAIGYVAAGLDMTRRDRQQDAKDHRRPWSLGKDLENGAVVAPLVAISDPSELAGRRIHLSVNGVLRQDSTLDDMVWTCAEIVAHLSGYYHLGAGDIIMTGTPAGVGAVVAGDVITGGIDGMPDVSLTLTAAE